MVVLNPPTFHEKHGMRSTQAGGMRNAYGASVRLMEAIGQAARRAREERGLSQSRIAAALKASGADQGTISRFEKGKAKKNGKLVVVQPTDLERTLLAYEEETGRSALAILREACDIYEAHPPTAEELAEDLEQALAPDDEELGEGLDDNEEVPPANETQAEDS